SGTRSPARPGTARRRGARRALRPPARGPVRGRAPAGRHRPGAVQRARPDPRRRAHRQPRCRQRRPGARPAGLTQCPGPHPGDGHPRSRGCPPRGAGAPSRRRPAGAGTWGGAVNLRPPALLVAALQLWRKRRLQALLSTLGIAAGVAGLVLAVALGEGARREMDDALGGLGARTLVVRHRPDAGGQPLTTAHQRRIVRLLGTELDGLAPVRADTLPVQGADGHLDAVRALATDRHDGALVPLPLRAGRFLADRDIAAGERVCVLGWALGRRLFPRGQVVGEPLRIGDEWFRVVGWLQPGALRLPGLGTLGLGGADQSLYVPFGVLGSPGDGELDELLV